MATGEYQAAIAALSGGKPAAFETPATAMLDPTSSIAMTVLTGATALPHYIAAAG
jgi:hypothetical protein